MTTKSVVEEVQQLLQKRGFQVDRQVRFDWLTNRAPTEVDVPLPSQLKYRLVTLHARLGGDWSALTVKRRQHLRVDLQIDGTTLIEIDEKHHFSSRRLTSLDFYDGIDHGLDLSQYHGLCSQYQDSADKYLRGREAVDFPFPGGLTAQRAYFDTTKDMLAAAHGYRLIRLPAPDGELTGAAKLALRVLV
ncbi:MAG: hypothetical protein V3S32_03875 [Acidimicrobiia bacterium]